MPGGDQMALLSVLGPDLLVIALIGGGVLLALGIAAGALVWNLIRPRRQT
jgi:hypothetical protein